MDLLLSLELDSSGPIRGHRVVAWYCPGGSISAPYYDTCEIRVSRLVWSKSNSVKDNFSRVATLRRNDLDGGGVDVGASHESLARTGLPTLSLVISFLAHPLRCHPQRAVVLRATHRFAIRLLVRSPWRSYQSDLAQYRSQTRSPS